jgi:hypothetical protein
MSNLFSAYASALGYQFQFRYALSLLFKAIQDGRLTQELSIEHLDDVAMEEDGVAQELVQTKHHLRPADLTDASTDLWKTLRVWCEYEASNVGTDVTLTLVTTASAVAGSVAAELRVGASPSYAALGARLETIARAGGNSSLISAYAAYLALSSAQQQALLARITVLDGTMHIQDIPGEIKRRYLSLTVNPRHVDDLYERLEGWWVAKAIEMLCVAPGVLTTISAITLRDKVVSLGQKYTEHNLPDDFPHQLELGEEDLGSHERIFVAQLRLVLDNNSRLRHAIGQYYRAYNQRSRWLDAGLIDDEALDTYSAYLLEEWTLAFHKMHDDLGDLPDEATLKRVGRNLFDWANEKTWTPIRSNYQNGAFPRGSLHMLANSMKIGWHPHFQERITALIVQAAEAAS